jgi:hypothetical protein
MAAAATATDDSAYRSEIDAWRTARAERLRADDGWLTLAGLFWLKPGASSFGSDPTSDIPLPSVASPRRAGTFVVDVVDKAKRVTVEIAPGVTATLSGRPITRAVLRSDAGDSPPDVLALGSLTMQVIERQGKLAIRLKDRNSKTRQNFKGLRYYPVAARYRIEARFVAHDQPVSISVPSILGGSEDLVSPGYVEFELNGKTLQLHPVTEAPGDPKLFFIFRDATAGKTTYGAGRFLYADPPQGGRVVLDFNKAYTPPCGFTAYATCPLPPVQNRLPISIEAGELFDQHHRAQ